MIREDEDFRRYCCKDSHVTLLASYTLEEELKELGLYNFYREIVQPLARVIVGINLRGLPVDQKSIDNSISGLGEEIENLQSGLNDLTGENLNVNADEFRDFLYDTLGLNPPSRTKKGQGKTDKATLKKLATAQPDIAPVIDLTLKIRNREKLKSTFLKRDLIEDDWRLHPNYKIGPDTGRLACKKPNFQNFPVGPARNMFRTKPGRKFVYADYSQVELRILAILAQDELLLAAFAAGEDIHDANARILFSVPPGQEVTERQRFFAKMFIYRLNYGGGDAAGLQDVGSELFHDVATSVIQGLINDYLAKHPWIVKFRNELGNQLKTRKKLFNAFGRPRVFFGNYKDCIRQAYNYPMQSGAADLMNTSLILLDKEIPNSLVLQVHDSVMLEVEEDKAEETAGKMKEILERPMKEFGGYRFPVKIKVGECWGEFK